MKDIADFAEPRLFLERHPDIRYVDALYVDICGRPRGKRCPVDKLASLYAEGVQSPQSHFLLDTNGDSSDPVGRGFSDGDPDTTLYPVPGSLAAVPWASEPLAQLLIGERAGEREGFPVDPRQILAGAAGHLAELGLKPVMAVELEFYLFDLEPNSEGRPRLAAAPFGGGRTTTSTNSIEELEAIGGFLGEVESFCRLQQIPASVVYLRDGGRPVRDQSASCGSAAGRRRSCLPAAPGHPGRGQAPRHARELHGQALSRCGGQRYACPCQPRR